MRIAGHGQIDRTKPLSFRFDGRELSGFQGDTLASALMANDVRLVARSFKYHRPRGVLTAGSEEPNALVTIGSGDAKTPNVRATMQELYQGLEAQSQNNWPSLRHDLLSVNDLFAPFLGAGFYYKTFMWPEAFWEKVYEPLIRRAAGLGALPLAHDLTRHEKAFVHCDLLVIGAGPAGLMAARTAALAGVDVILIDEHTAAGGRLLSETEEIEGRSGALWAADLVASLGALPNVRIMTRTTVTGAYDGGVFGAVERVGLHLAAPGVDLPMECFWRIHTRACVLAAGAIERPLAFANNDRPGILMAGAVRTYLHRFGASPGASVAVFGTNDSAHRTARDLVRAGVRVKALIDTRMHPGGAIAAQTEFRVISGAQVIATKGRQALREVTVRAAGKEQQLVVDTLAMSGGWNPSVHLTCHLNGRPVWRPDIHAFVPAPNAVPGMIPAGACNGTFGTAGCLSDGQTAALAALDTLGVRAPVLVAPRAQDTALGHAPLWYIEGRGRAWLDFQNDVTVKDVQAAAAENFASVEHMKRYTTQGMAPDQGKTSSITALAVLADATGRSIPGTGTTTYRPPYVPVTLGAFGAGARGKGFAPERLTTSHDATLQRGAPMIEAGLWYRPGYFPRAGEKTWREACDREVAMVRDTVGICDVSTLGKIDIQGPDAVRILNLVYANGFARLTPGRVRYGLMLREDGHVMDDGTTACWAENHYIMTTTTAAAGEVMKHLAFVHQGLHPEWDVQMVSITEQWAQFAIAGPLARTLLEALLDAPVPDDTMPFMHCAPVSVAGIAARLFRISFSGELGYEIAVPARFGDSLFRMLVALAETLGGGPYGMEALNVLRIEKGFITHSEITGRVTAFDIGMDRMVSLKKDCIGRAASRRAGLLEPDRERMIGLRPVHPDGVLTAGAHLFAVQARAVAAQDQGYVTSVGFSPTLGHFIGLGFLKSGPGRHGERMMLVDHLRQIRTEVEICAPVFVDREGMRAHG
jgi:heterotetrameric sarcosine oxidase alpha subunit